jgi:hypothetical protein
VLRSIATKRGRYCRRGRAKKVKGGGGDIATCWATLYDAFAARYGLRTPQEFYEGYTLRQVTYLLRVIDKAKYDDLAVQAKLHGVKVKPKVEALRLTKEERAEADTQAMSVLDRMRKQHEAKKDD